MSSREAWDHIPNLSGVKSDQLEDTRGGDPSRFYPSVRGGDVDAVTGRILDIPRASVFLNAGGSLANSTVTLVSWDSEEYDSDGMWSPLAPGRLTARTPGNYRVTSWFTWGANAAGPRAMFIRRTVATSGLQFSYGIGPLGEGTDVQAVLAGFYTPTGPWSYEMDLNAGDYVECFITQISGGALAWIAATAALRSNGFQASLISTFGSDN